MRRAMVWAGVPPPVPLELRRPRPPIHLQTSQRIGGICFRRQFLPHRWPMRGWSFLCADVGAAVAGDLSGVAAVADGGSAFHAALDESGV